MKKTIKNAYQNNNKLEIMIKINILNKRWMNWIKLIKKICLKQKFQTNSLKN